MEFEFRPDREELLRTLCAEMGRSVDDFINEAVLTFMEDYEDGRDAQVVLDRIRSGEEKTYTIQEVMKEHGMALEDLRDSEEANGQAGSNDGTPDRVIPGTQTHQAA